MEENKSKTMNDYTNQTTQCKFTKDENTQISYNLPNFKTKKEKSSTKSLLNFISNKNKIVLNSNFDQLGSKKFLTEREKAMEEIVLEDTILENTIKTNKKRSKNKVKHYNNKRFYKHISNDAVMKNKNNKKLDKIFYNNINELNNNEFRKDSILLSDNISDNSFSFLNEKDSLIISIVEEMLNLKV